MSVINIKNKYLRRFVLIVGFLPVMLLVLVVAAIGGMHEGARDLIAATLMAWKGNS